LLYCHVPLTFAKDLTYANIDGARITALKPVSISDVYTSISNLKIKSSPIDFIPVSIFKEFIGHGSGYTPFCKPIIHLIAFPIWAEVWLYFPHS